MGEFRLIVAGSREWSDPLSLRAALATILGRMPRGVTLIVVQGGHVNPDYSTNADRMAQEWAMEMEADGLPARPEAWPADWEGPCREFLPDGGPGCPPGHRVMFRGASTCPKAGPYRNEEMCAAGASLGLGALKVGTRSSGTKDCLRRMARHGIPFELVIDGSARGLPEDLVARAARR